MSAKSDRDGLWEDGGSFDNLDLHERLVSAVKGMGLERPTRIQAAGLGPIIKGSDVVLGAETGSGKTLAYLLPIVHSMLMNAAEQGAEGSGEGGEQSDSQKDSNRPVALVLVPNQELANQVLRVLDGLHLGQDASGVVVAGAQGYPKGIPCKVLIATPSGVIRHTDPNLLALVRTVVVDEADMLLDGGFLDDVQRVLDELKPRVSRSAQRRHQ